MLFVTLFFSCVLGVAQMCTPMVNIAIVGDTVKSYPGVNTTLACCDLCSLVKNCTGFSINNSVCALKASTKVAPMPGIFSGLLNPPPPPPPPRSEYLDLIEYFVLVLVPN